MKSRMGWLATWQWSLALVMVLPLVLAGLSHRAFAAGGAWTTETSMPYACDGAVAGVIDGKLYVAGGYGLERQYVKSLFVYDPATKLWGQKASMSTARFGAVAGVINGVLYVAGGFNAVDDVLNTIEKYDPGTNTWTTMGAILPAKTYNASAGVLNGKLYVVSDGGRLFVYDPTTDSCESKAPPPIVQANAAAGVIDGILYVVGGVAPGEFPTNRVVAYNPATNTWAPKDSKASMPNARCLLGVGVIEGKLYAVGGMGPPDWTSLQTVEVYDPVTNNWTTDTSMPTARQWAVHGVINRSLYAVGGKDLGGYLLSSMEAFTPPETNHPPLASAGNNVEVTSGQLSATVIQGTASDPDNDPLQYQWLEGDTSLDGDWKPVDADGRANLSLSSVSLGVGAHTLTLKVFDGHTTASSKMILTVDNSTPNATASGGTYQIGTTVFLYAEVSDFDGDSLTYCWKEGDETFPDSTGTIATSAEGTPVDLPAYLVSGLPLGSHTLTLEVCDGINAPVTQNITVVIQDTQAPNLAPMATPTILWPPNKQMVNVAINANATDNSGSRTLSATVASNEPGDPLNPDWNTPDIDQTSGIITLQLRADRAGNGHGRVYTVTVSATDASGNTTNVAVPVIVPHDQGKR